MRVAKVADTRTKKYFASFKLKDKLKGFELFPVQGAHIFNPTIGSGVDDYLEQHKIDWKKECCFQIPLATLLHDFFLRFK